MQVTAKLKVVFSFDRQTIDLPPIPRSSDQCSNCYLCKLSADPTKSRRIDSDLRSNIQHQGTQTAATYRIGLGLLMPTASLLPVHMLPSFLRGWQGCVTGADLWMGDGLLDRASRSLLSTN